MVEGSYVEVASLADGINLLVHRESAVEDHTVYLAHWLIQQVWCDNERHVPILYSSHTFIGNRSDVLISPGLHGY